MNFDLIGEILREADPPGISKECWIDLIREHPNLAPGLPREGINPFTKERTVIHPRPDVARVLVGGDEVGSMSWAEDDSNLISVFGEPQAVVPLAIEIAKVLGGQFRVLASDGQR